MITGFQVNLREILGPTDAILELVHVGEGVAIWDGDPVYAAIVDTEPETTAVPLRHEEHG